ncbi:MAG: TonB-dependent receptor [Bacteroidales bacterium]|nr:TonB-dependent receptor [Bacteroidales bacterium]
MELDEIVVIGQREDALPNVVRTLTAVTRTEVERAPSLSINDLLRTLPSIDLRQRGPLGVQADLSVRGGSFDQTQVLLNGVNFSDPQTGHYSLNIPIDLSSVSRMEILQGLSAPGAIGGALNIATGNQPLNTANLQFSGGQYGYLNALGNAVAGNEKCYSFLSASCQQSTGYINNTDFRKINLYNFTKYRSGIGDWEFQSGFQDKPCGANGFYSFKYPDQFDYTRTFLASLRWQKEIKNFKLSALAYHRMHYNRFELFRNEAPDWYTGHNYHQTQINGGETHLTYRSMIGQTTFSAELRNEQILSTVLGLPMDTPKYASFEGNVQYTNEANRILFRGLLSHGYEYGKFAVNAGASFHHNNDYGSKICFAGNAGYKITPFLFAYTAVNQSLRLPTFTDLYYKSATHEANPNLKPEEAVVYEVGSKLAKNAWTATANIFYRRGKNIIDWVYTEGASVSKSLNYSHINAAGAEVSCQWNPSKYNPESIVRQIGFNYTFTKLDKENAPQTTSYALDYLNHKLHLNLEHSAFFQKLKASWHFTLYDRAGSYVDPVSGQTAPFDPFALVDARLCWSEARYDIFTEVNNLFNVVYFDYGGLQQPKFWFTAGIALKFRPAAI